MFWVSGKSCECSRVGVLRVLDPNSSLTTARYTYISDGFLEDNVDDWDGSKWAIGWWKHDTPKNILNAISKYQGGEFPSGLVRKGEEIIKAGRGFIGEFYKTHSLKFNFPSAIDLPSKK